MSEHRDLSGASLHEPKSHAASHHDGTDDLTQLPDLTADVKIKKTAPMQRFTGSTDFQLGETSDEFVLQKNDGTEGSPSWTTIVNINAAGDIRIGGDEYVFSSDTDTGMQRTGANTLVLKTGGTTAITIDSSQDVTIAESLTVTNDLVVTDDVTINGAVTIGADEPHAVGTIDSAIGFLLAPNMTTLDINGTGVKIAPSVTSPAVGFPSTLYGVEIAPELGDAGINGISTVYGTYIKAPTEKASFALSNLPDIVTLAIEGASSGLPLKSTSYALHVLADTSLFEGPVIIDDAGPHSIGTTTVDYYQLHQSGAFTSLGSSTICGAKWTRTTLTMANGDVEARYYSVDPTVLTQGNSETIHLVASLWIDEPGITVRSGDSVTTGASLYISAAPTEGSNNYAALVNAGDVRLRVDNQKLIFGAGTDAEIYYDGTNLVIDPQAVGGGDLSIAGGGIIVGSPTGGSKGAGAINAVAVYDDNVLLTDFVFEDDYELAPIAEMRAFYREHKHLPTIKGRDEWDEGGKFSLGQLANMLWETVEVQARYISQLDARLAAIGG